MRKLVGEELCDELVLGRFGLCCRFVLLPSFEGTGHQHRLPLEHRWVLEKGSDANYPNYMFPLRV
ncbi:hypothetical protein LguiA_020162 [Lonicera macranthoides]